MKILNIINFSGLSFPKSGGQKRYRCLTKELIRNCNEVTVLEPKEFYHPEDNRVTEIYCYENIRLFDKVLFNFRDLNLNYLRTVNKIIKTSNIDLVMISHPSGILTVKLVSLLQRKKILLVYDAHNVESEFVKDIFKDNSNFSWYEQLIIRLNITFLEILCCKFIADHITCVSEQDRNTFIQKYDIDPKKVSTAPSGCYFDGINFYDESEKMKLKNNYNINHDSVIIVFHGTYMHPPNQEAFNLIENYIAPKFNKNVLFLVGGTECLSYKKENFRSIGFIEDLSDYLAMADIAIVPIRRGGGTKLKVFDYMTAGLPIVITEKGIEGIEAKDGKHALITRDVNKEFIKAIQYLIENENERDRLGSNARRLAEEKYDWAKIGFCLNEILENRVCR